MQNTLKKPCEGNFSIPVENSCNSQNFVEFYFYRDAATISCECSTKFMPFGITGLLRDIVLVYLNIQVLKYSVGGTGCGVDILGEC